MKKIIIFLLTFFIGIQTTLASTKTFERTTDNYLVPDDIDVTSKNQSAVLKTPAVDATEKIYDFADLLTDAEEEKLYDKVSNFIEDTNYDLALVTINKNNKYNAMNYADDFFDYNSFGIGSSRDGLLILIDMDTREIYVSTSGMAIKMYSDVRIDSIIDAGFSYLKSAKYYDCLNTMINKTSDYYSNGYPSSNSNLEIDKFGHATVIKKMPYFKVIRISLLICIIISAILAAKTSSKIKKQNTVTYINTDLTSINKTDQFLTTHTSRIRRESSSSSSGGGSGSSFHSSSSGRSHGGGGRSF